MLASEAKSLLRLQSPGFLPAAGGSVSKLQNVTNLLPNSSSHLRLGQPTHMLEQNSVSLLPVLGTEITVDKRRQSSRVELSRRDMQNFLVNGSISKEFIKTNKKELQKFIKSQAHSDQNSFFKGYNEVYSTQKLPTKDQSSHLNEQSVHDTDKLNRSPLVDKDSVKRKMFAATQKSQSPDGLFAKRASHQKPEKGFKGETSVINNRVLETWINETLTDAQHLDIPGLILKPQFQLPISRYGIDKMKLTNAGIANDDVDRIYRCLFVYSVGFFEMLKTTFAQTERGYETITAIWKVYQVLLEYCCKTDYKIMMAEVSTKYQESLEKLLQENLARIQSYVENERILKQNIETMQNHQDKLEKEKQNEKQLRLKLEDEYVQNSKNHEEEVKLRLKFEHKLNKMYEEMREINLKNERIKAELAATQRRSGMLDMVLKNRTDELTKAKQRIIELECTVKQQDEKTEDKEKDIKRKVSQLKTLESTTTKLTDLKEANEFDIIDGKVKMETMRKQMQLLSDENVRVVNELEQSQVIQANAEKVAKEFEALYNDMKNQFDIVSKERHELRQKAESLDIEIKDQQENLIELRKNDATLSEKLLAVETSNAKLNAAYIKTKGKLDELEEEVSQGRKGIQEINDGRHATLEALEQRTFELKETTQNLEDARDQISALESTLRTRDFDIKDLQDQLKAAHQIIQDNLNMSKKDHDRLLKELTEQTTLYKSTDHELQQWKERYDTQLQLLLDKEKTIVKKEVVIQELVEENKKLMGKIMALKEELQLSKTKIETAEEAMRAAQQAQHESELRQKTLEEQVRTHSVTVMEMQDNYDQQMQAVVLSNEIEADRQYMTMEDVTMHYQAYKSQLDWLSQEKEGLLVVKARQEELEGLFKQATETIEQMAAQIQSKEIELHAQQAAHKEKLYALDQQMKKDQKAYNMKVNDLEQKITSDSLQAAQAARKYGEEVKDLKKQINDITIQMKQQTALAARGGGRNARQQQQSSQAKSVKERGTQTVNSLQRPSKQDSKNIQNSQGASDMNIGDQSINIKRIRPARQDTAQSNASGDSRPGLDSGLHALYKLSKSAGHDNGTEREDSPEMVQQDSLFEDQPEPVEDEVIEQPDPEEVKAAKQAEMFAKFKIWVLESELRLLKKVQYMVIHGIEVSQPMIDDMRAQFVIPVELRSIKISFNQHRELAEEQQRQKDKFQADLTASISFETEIDEMQNLITDKKLEAEVLDLKQKLIRSGQLNMQAAVKTLSDDKKLGSGQSSIVRQSWESEATRTDKFMTIKGSELITGRPVHHTMSSQEPGETGRERVDANRELADSKRVHFDEGTKSIAHEVTFDARVESGQVQMVDAPKMTQAAVSSQSEAQESVTTNLNQIEPYQLTEPQVDHQLPTDQESQPEIKAVDFMARFQNAFSKFGQQNKQLIVNMLDQQKDRMAYKAKQLASKQQVILPSMPTMKVGKHFIVPQVMKESDKIKHQQAFLQELRVQKGLYENKEEIEKTEAQRIDEEKLADQIRQEERRLKRMQQIVIIREDQIKPVQHTNESMEKYEHDEFKFDGTLSEMDNSHDLGISLNMPEAFQTFANEKEHPVASAGEKTEAEFSQKMQTDNKAITMTMMDTLTDPTQMEPTDRPSEQDFLKLQEFKAGGVAHVNRTFNKREDAPGDTPRKKDMRALIKAVESRREV